MPEKELKEADIGASNVAMIVESNAARKEPTFYSAQY